jgi:hypothetical protein
MSKMYIRVRKDGFIYDYNDILARNPECEVVPEEIAYPERFAQPEIIEKVKVERKKRGGALDLTTADIPEPPVYTPPELAADASRGLPE